MSHQLRGRIVHKEDLYKLPFDAYEVGFRTAKGSDRRRDKVRTAAGKPSLQGSGVAARFLLAPGIRNSKQQQRSAVCGRARSGLKVGRKQNKKASTDLWCFILRKKEAVLCT